MDAVGDAYNEARLAISEAAADIKPRTCTVSVPASGAGDAYGEQEGGAATEIVGVPASFKALRAFERAAESGSLAGADHLLEVPYFSGGVRLQVPANATVVFDADSYNPAMTFRVTGQLESSSGLWQQIAATLVQ